MEEGGWEGYNMKEGGWVGIYFVRWRKAEGRD